jgi:hypothetical protein
MDEVGTGRGSARAAMFVIDGRVLRNGDQR